MFAAGSGIAPFYGFLQARADQTEVGENWLLFGTRTPNEFFKRPVFERLEADGKLHLRMAFSRADVVARFDPEAGQYSFEKGRRQRIDQLIEADEQAAILWNFLRSEREGGQHGYFTFVERPALPFQSWKHSKESSGALVAARKLKYRTTSDN